MESPTTTANFASGPVTYISAGTTTTNVTEAPSYPAATYSAPTTTTNVTEASNYPVTTYGATTTTTNATEAPSYLTTNVTTAPPSTVTYIPSGPQGKIVDDINPVCRGGEVPWPMIIVSVVGGGLTIYTAVAPGVSSERRTFGAILLALWTIAWALILWVIWKDCHHPAAWWLVLVPLTLAILFFVLIIVLDLGSR